MRYFFTQSLLGQTEIPGAFSVGVVDDNGVEWELHIRHDGEISLTCGSALVIVPRAANCIRLESR